MRRQPTLTMRAPELRGRRRSGLPGREPGRQRIGGFENARVVVRIVAANGEPTEGARFQREVDATGAGEVSVKKLPVPNGQPESQSQSKLMISRSDS